MTWRLMGGEHVLWIKDSYVFTQARDRSYSIWELKKDLRWVYMSFINFDTAKADWDEIDERTTIH